MTGFERQSKILELLKERRFVTVDTISAVLYASGATVRRDLAVMAERGLIKRVRGGAVLFDGISQDLPRLLRENQNVDGKKIIAQFALQFLHDSMTVFLDSSSTAVALAERMGEFQKLSVVTNSIPAACYLNDTSNATIYLCGGVITNHNATMGPSSISFAEGICGDVMFFSCRGFSPEFGTTESNMDASAVKVQMLKNVQKRILLCDSSKIGRTFFCKCCPTEKIDVLITDQKPPQEFLEKLPPSMTVLY